MSCIAKDFMALGDNSSEGFGAEEMDVDDEGEDLSYASDASLD